MANIKRNKGIKGPTIAICSIATVALVGVGFAAWVISGSSSVTGTGSITVDVVTDSSYPIILGAWEDGKQDIVFGIPNSSDAQSMDHASWLTVSYTEGGADVENLSVTLNFNVYNVKENDDLSQILSVDFDTEAGSGARYIDTTSYTNGYVSDLPSAENGRLILSYQAEGSGGTYTEVSESMSVTSDDIQSDNEGSFVACQVTATFEWGEAFGGYNPYYYSYLIEEAESSDTTVSVDGVESGSLIQSQLGFSQALQQLEDDFGSGIPFVLTITAEAPGD